MIRILHAADLHLDSPFDALGEQKAALRRREQRELLRSLASLRAGRGCDLVLLSGDLFDSDAAWTETEELLRLTLSELAVPVFISPGNHDYYKAGGRWDSLRLPENVHVFTSPDFEAVTLAIVEVHAVQFVSEQRRFLSPRARADFHYAVALVVLVLGEENYFYFVAQGGELFLAGINFVV